MSMVHPNPIVLAALTGFVSGLMLSIPVGPINLTILNEGARRGFRWALLIGMGATTMEVIYCFVAFTGFASFFTRGYIKAAMELGSFVFLLFLGIKFLLTKEGPAHVRFGSAVERMEARFQKHYEGQDHSAFITGLLRVMGNVGVLVFWIILAANFISREWVSPDWTGKTACVLGVAAGTGLWFFVLSWLSAKGQGKFSERTLIRMEHFSGILLLALAMIHGGTIVWQMHKANLANHHAMLSRPLRSTRPNFTR